MSEMERIPLGEGMSYTRVVDGNEEWVGIILWYSGCAVHEDCGGSVPFTNFPGERAKWDVVSKEPLTLHPSILRKPCGLHGWIQNGKWVPA